MEMEQEGKRAMEGRGVLVTAGAGGIGRAIAQTMAHAGARVHVCDVDAQALERLKEEEPGISQTRADVASEDDVDRVFEDFAAQAGDLDALVNCAGIAGPTAATEDVTPEEWRRCVAVNLEGTFLCARRALPLLKAKGGGSIVNLSSTAGLHGYPNRSPYSSAKWAIIGFTKTVAIEAGPCGVRINAICPGFVEGERIDGVIRRQAQISGEDERALRDRCASSTSLRTFVRASDIAAMALYLCSDAGAKISGQAIAVDGHTEHM